MEIPGDLLYTTTHEWAKKQDNEVIVGLTAHAQEELRDVVFAELPKLNDILTQAKPAAVVESVKAAFDIYAPVSGKVVRINETVVKSPQIINQDCYGEAWLFSIEPSDWEEFSKLLSPEDYSKQIQTQTH